MKSEFAIEEYSGSEDEEEEQQDDNEEQQHFGQNANNIGSKEYVTESIREGQRSNMKSLFKSVFGNEVVAAASSQSESSSVLNSQVIDFQEKEHAKLAVLLLMKAVKTQEEQKFLKRGIQGLSFFANHEGMFQGNKINHSLFKQITLEAFSKGQVIFNQGDAGSTYYIVLAGSVGCLIKKPQSPNQQHGNQIEQNNTNESNESEDVLSQKRFQNMDCVKVYNSGSAFGEISLMTNAPRTATMVCKEDSFFMTLSKEGFDKIIGVYHEKVIRDRLLFLQSFSFFQGIASDKLLSILHFFKIETHQKHKVIFKEGDTVLNWYFVKSGEVELLKYIQVSNKIGSKSPKEIIPLWGQTNNPNSSKNTKRLVPVLIAGSGSLLGEESISAQIQVHQTQAKVSSAQAVVFSISKDKLLSILNQNNCLDVFLEVCKSKQHFSKIRESLVKDVFVSEQKSQEVTQRRRNSEIMISKFQLEKLQQQQQQQHQHNQPAASKTEFPEDIPDETGNSNTECLFMKFKDFDDRQSFSNLNEMRVKSFTSFQKPHIEMKSISQLKQQSYRVAVIRSTDDPITQYHLDKDQIQNRSSINEFDLSPVAPSPISGPSSTSQLKGSSFTKAIANLQTENEAAQRSFSKDSSRLSVFPSGNIDFFNRRIKTEQSSLQNSPMNKPAATPRTMLWPDRKNQSEEVLNKYLEEQGFLTIEAQSWQEKTEFNEKLLKFYQEKNPQASKEKNIFYQIEAEISRVAQKGVIPNHPINIFTVQNNQSNTINGNSPRRIMQSNRGKSQNDSNSSQFRTNTSSSSGQDKTFNLGGRLISLPSEPKMSQFQIQSVQQLLQKSDNLPPPISMIVSTPNTRNRTQACTQRSYFQTDPSERLLKEQVDFIKTESISQINNRVFSLNKNERQSPLHSLPQLNSNNSNIKVQEQKQNESSNKLNSERIHYKNKINKESPNFSAFQPWYQSHCLTSKLSPRILFSQSTQERSPPLRTVKVSSQLLQQTTLSSQQFNLNEQSPLQITPSSNLEQLTSCQFSGLFEKNQASKLSSLSIQQSRNIKPESKSSSRTSWTQQSSNLSVHTTASFFRQPKRMSEGGNINNIQIKQLTLRPVLANKVHIKSKLHQ